MKSFLIAAGLLLAVVLSFARLNAQPAHKIYIGMYCDDRDGWLPDFVSGDYVGLDDAYIAVLTQYGYNLILSQDPSRLEVTASVNPSTAFLDRIQRAGMKIILGSTNFYVYKPSPLTTPSCVMPVYDATKVGLGLHHYSHHPAVIGFDVIDEPCTSVAGIFDQVAAQVLDTDNTKIPFVNFFPDFASADQLESNTCSSGSSMTYPDYIDAFISLGHVKALSFDYYPYYNLPTECNDKRSYFLNLDLMARKAADNDLPLFVVVNTKALLTSGCSPYSRSALNDLKALRYNFYTSLMHGAKGVLYWLREDYDGPVSAPSVMYPTFDSYMTTTTKDSLGVMHRKILNHAYELGNLEYTASYHATALPLTQSGLGQVLPTGTAWSNFLADAATRSIFSDGISSPSTPLSPMPTLGTTTPNVSDYLAFSYLQDPAGKKYLWILNKDVRSAAVTGSFSLNFTQPKTVADILEDRICTNTTGINIELQPGEGKLFLIQDYDATLNINYDFVNLNETHSAGTINIQSGVDFTGSSRDRFYAENIIVNQVVDIAPGTDGDVFLEGDIPGCGTFYRMPEGTERTENVSRELSVKLVPNPNAGDFTLRIDGDADEMYSIYVEDLLGQAVYSGHAPGNSLKEMRLNDLRGGLYLVRVKSARGAAVTVKTVVNN